MESNTQCRQLLQEITLHNILSFGPHGVVLELRPLNVLIGPNGSGKSNLVEVIDFLRSTPGDLRNTIRTGGGVTDWIWKGAVRGVASLDAVIANPEGNMDLRHVVAFTEENKRFHLIDEKIENKQPYDNQQEPYFYYRYQHGYPILNVRGEERRLTRETVEPDLSILSQRRDPESYPEISYLAKAYDDIRVYREWSFGRSSVFREPQQADMRNDRLEENFSNLGLFLNRLRQSPQAKRAILSALRDLYDGLDDFDVIVEGGTVQVFFTEGDFVIPATRLSDGTLRFLCLLAILYDPAPPRLICIEEPELGLHPDIIPALADHLVVASERTQLIITTHSDILVDALTEQPESIVICEKVDSQTKLSRLEYSHLQEWLDSYRLGSLWTRGVIGGTRW